MLIMLKITDADAVVVNAAFKPQPRPPVYAYGQILLQQLAFYHEDKNTPFTEAELTQYATWQYGIDNDYLFSTSPAALTVTGFTIDGNILSFQLRTDAAKVKTILGNNPTAAAVAELKGYLPGETLPSLQYQFAVQLRNAVIADGASTPPSEPQLYYTAAQVYALIHAAPDRQFSVDGLTLWHDIRVDADLYYRERRLEGEWSDAVKFPLPNDVKVYFSADGLTAWHFPYAGGDAWMRFSTDGGTTWGAGVFFKGERGLQGIQGPPPTPFSDLVNAAGGTNCTWGAGDDALVLTVPHNLNTTSLSVCLRDTVTGRLFINEFPIEQIIVVNANTLKIYFAELPAVWYEIIVGYGVSAANSSSPASNVEIEAKGDIGKYINPAGMDHFMKNVPVDYILFNGDNGTVYKLYFTTEVKTVQIS